MMKKAVFMVIIGIGVTMMLSGCGSKTPKEQIYDSTYEAFSEGDKKVTPEKAKCIAEKTVAKLSNEAIDNMIKMKKLKDDGYESEIALHPEMTAALSTYMTHMQTAFYECRQ